MRTWVVLPLGLGFAVMLACGGGGGGGSTASNLPSMTVNPASISVSGALGQAAPSAAVTISLSQAYAGNLYIYGSNLNQNVTTNVTQGTQTSTSVQVLFTFNAPDMLGVGTYTDQITLGVSTDQAGANNIPNSPCRIPVTYTVAPAPTFGVTSISPASAPADGPGFTLTVNGNLFSDLSTVNWNGSARTTTYVSSTQLTAHILAADLLSPGPLPVTVTDLIQSGSSGSQTFTVQPAAFGAYSLAPASAYVGTPGLTLTVNGALYTAASVVQWNGAARPTTFVSGTQLTAQIAAADLAAAGTATLTVLNPAGQGGLSNGIPFAVAAPDAVAYQIDPGHSGSMTFPSVTLPGSALWRAALDGQPSYALLVKNLVYVTETISGGCELVALDQASGDKVWGPVSVGYGASATYDAGQVFVLSGASAVLLQSFDATTGKPGWSTSLGDIYGVSGPPTAANGIVYCSYSQALFAFNETNGAQLWHTYAGTNGGPAVTSTGVYQTYTDEAQCFDPTTGTLLWDQALGGDGGGGATPAVADGLVIAPDGFGTYSGQVLDAATGAVKGAYTCDCTPAIGPQIGYFLQSGTLRAINLTTDLILWSFAGDGHLNTSPVVVNNNVFIGSSTGNLYGLNATTGTQVWLQNLGAAIPAGAGWSAFSPFTGLTAGDGLLMVPAGTSLTAFKLVP